MKIYTRSGDKGKTSLFSGMRVAKNHLRVMTYGTLDELNSILGICHSVLESSEHQNWLSHTQRQIFLLSSWLANPTACENHASGAEEAWPGKDNMELEESEITDLEQIIDSWESSLPALTNFILPGGSKVGAQIHYARCICRRAERECVALIEAGEEIPEYIVRYLNRLSDALFVFARLVNSLANAKETPWT